MLGIGLLAVVIVGQRRATAEPPPTTPEMPGLYSVLGGDGRGILLRTYPGGYVCTIEFAVEERQVEFHWKYSPGYSLGDSPAASTQVVMPVWYWPNFASWIADDALLVAGVAPRSGRTIIEVWEIESPSSGPSVLPVAHANGTTEHVWDLPVVSSVDLVLDTENPECQLVTYAKQNLGREGSVFVRFDSSGDLYDLSLASGGLSVVASSVAGSAPLHVPQLAHAGPWSVGGTAVDHELEGYVYGLMTHIYQAPNHQIVMFIDDDRDGAIDSFVLDDPTGYYHGDYVVDSY